MDDRPIKILVVDDDEAKRYAVSQLLRHHGYEVVEAVDGAAALVEVQSRPDLIVLDVKLPDINGMEVCRRIKADPQTSHIPVLQLSSTFMLSENKVEGLDAGADAYMTDVMYPAEILATIRALLRAREAERALRESEEGRNSLLRTEQSARQEAEHANRLKDEFLATLSHELRTPLTAILGWTQLILTGQLSSEDVMSGLGIIENNAQVQARLIEDLLDVSRIISGKLRLSVEVIDFAPVIAEAVASVQSAADARQIVLDVRTDAQAGSILGDADRLQQVVWNLLSNAIKFTPKGGRVTVRLERINSHVELSVADNGQGIRPEFLPHVFDRFRQADATSARMHTGLGLGLAIVRHLTELHGGHARVASDGPGKGAMFTIRLPITPLKREDVPAPLTDSDTIPKVKRSSNELPRSLTGVSVLLVEDETDARDVLRRMLERCRAQVAMAASSQAGFEQFQRARPDIILSDIGMPGEDGYRFIMRIRELEGMTDAPAPAIALTAFARLEDRQKAMLSGFQAHVAKPVAAGNLTAIIGRLLGRSGESA